LSRVSDDEIVEGEVEPNYEPDNEENLLDNGSLDDGSSDDVSVSFPDSERDSPVKSKKVPNYREEDFNVPDSTDDADFNPSEEDDDDEEESEEDESEEEEMESGDDCKETASLLTIV
jgi:hypothetical protein